MPPQTKKAFPAWAAMLVFTSLPITLPAMLLGIGVQRAYTKTRKAYRHRYLVKEPVPTEPRVWDEPELLPEPEFASCSTPGQRIPPHNFLPPEIMSIIFIHLSDSYIEYQYKWDAEGCYTGLGWNKHLSALKSVCKTWKTIINSTPALFRCFHLTVPNHECVAADEGSELPHRRRLGALFEQAEAWLQCAKSVDVDLYLHLGSTVDADVSNLLTKLLLSLVPRIKLLMYEGPTDLLLGIFTILPMMSRLEELRIHYEGGSSYDSLPSVLPPQLRTLTLGRRFQHKRTSVPTSVELGSPFPAYKQVTRLHLSDSSIVLQIMHSCPALIECVIYKNHYSQNSGYELPEAPIVHRDLLSLEVRAISEFPFGGDILHGLSLPALQHLTIQNPTSTSPWNIQLPQILKMYGRNPFPLKSLSLCRISHADILPLLARVEDTLVSIHIWECQISVGCILRYLTIPRPGMNENRSRNMMNLEELVVVDRCMEYGARPLMMNELVNFVDSRVWEDSSSTCEAYGRRKLKRVVIQTKEQGEMRRKELERWKEKGCVVTNRAPRVFF